MGRTSTPALLARTALLALISGLVAVPDAPAQTPSFTLMGSSTEGVTNAYGLSSDGRACAGSVGRFGYRWTADSGRTVFGQEAGLPELSLAYALSGDGSTVVGESGGVLDTVRLAYRWSGPGTFQTLGTVSFWNSSVATGVNNDGSVIVGNLSVNDNGSRGFRWTQSGGMQELPGGTNTRVNRISRDGSVIVGESGLFSGAPQAVRWTQDGGMQPLAPLNGSFTSYARGVNFDGSYIVGLTGNATNSPATMWHNGVPAELATPAAWLQGANPLAVSDDGRVVVGTYFGGAAVWTPETTFMPLSDYLTSNGVVIPAGLRLEMCNSISADGKTFSGWTNGPFAGAVQGFVATIPAPGVLPVLGAALLAFRRRRADRSLS